MLSAVVAQRVVVAGSVPASGAAGSVALSPTDFRYWLEAQRRAPCQMTSLNPLAVLPVAARIVPRGATATRRYEVLDPVRMLRFAVVWTEPVLASGATGVEVPIDRYWVDIQRSVPCHMTWAKEPLVRPVRLTVVPRGATATMRYWSEGPVRTFRLAVVVALDEVPVLTTGVDEAVVVKYLE